MQTPKIYIYRGAQPCHAYIDKYGNAWFSSDYPKRDYCFRLTEAMGPGEIASIGQEGFRTLKVVRFPVYWSSPVSTPL